MNNSQKGSVPTAAGQISAVQLGADIEAFVARVKQEVSGEGRPDNREMFPGFKIHPNIKGRIVTAASSIKAGEMSGAVSLFEAAKLHYKNSQAAYAKKQLRGDVQAWLDEMIRGKYPADLIGPMLDVVDEFMDEIEKPYFDLNIVSQLYWDALETSERGVKEFEARRRNAPKRAAQKEKRTLSPEQAAQLKAAREEAERQAEAERLRECDAAASKVLELVSAL